MNEIEVKATVQMSLDLNSLMGLLVQVKSFNIPHNMKVGVTRDRLEKLLAAEPKTKKFYFDHRVRDDDINGPLRKLNQARYEAQKLADKLMEGFKDGTPVPPRS